MIQIKKIFHHGSYQIGIFCPNEAVFNKKLQLINAIWSKTRKCWYIGYTKENYNRLQQLFDAIEVIHDTEEATATDDITIENIIETRAIRSIGRWEGKLQLHQDIGKYWVLQIPYTEHISQAMLKIKGVYWNKKENAFLILRHVTVRTKG